MVPLTVDRFITFPSQGIPSQGTGSIDYGATCTHASGADCLALHLVGEKDEDVDANDMIYPELHAALLRSTQAQGTSPPTSRCSQFPTKDIEKHLNDKKEGLWRKLRRHYHDEDYDTGKSLAKGLETFINSQPTFHCIEAPYLIVKYVADAETFKKCQTRGETVDVRTLRGRGSEKAGE